MSDFIIFNPEDYPVQGRTEARPAVNVVPQQAQPVQNELNKTEQKPYTLRKLCADDLFPMSRIISGIGLNEFKSAFDPNEIKTLVKSISKSDDDNAPVSDDVVASVGMSVVLSVAQVIFSHLSACKDDIYTFLSNLSGIPVEGIGQLDPDVFLEMIIDVIQKPEFENFLKVVSKLFK